MSSVSVIVTGASGFIGAALVELLRQAGHDVTALTRDRGDVTTAEYWRSLPKADHLVHLAGRSYVPDSWKLPIEFIATNVTGTAHAVEYCRAARAHLVFVSAYVYGVPQRLPVAEDHPVAPNNPYALSKVLAEQACSFHASVTGLPVTIVRPFNIYGPGQQGPFLVPKIVQQLVAGDEIRVDDLSPRRDYLFVGDLVAGIERALACPDGLRVINFGSGVSYSVAAVIELAQRAADTRVRVLCNEQKRDNEIPDVRADIGRAIKLLAWQPQTSFIDGLRLCLQAGRHRQADAVKELHL